MNTYFTGSRRFKIGLSVTLGLLLLSAGMAIAAFTLFETEANANLHFDGTATQDWENALIATSDPNTIVANSTPPSAVDNPALPGTAVLFYDNISSSSLTDNTIFTQGSKETAPSIPPPPDPNGVTDWVTVVGNVPPNKDDISLVYSWSDDPLDNLVLAMERINILGDSHLDFGIDHRPWVLCPESSTDLCPQRTAGDLVLAYDLTNGGSITTLRVFVWEIPGDGIQIGPTDGCDGEQPVLPDGSSNNGNLGKSCVGGKTGASKYGWEEIPSPGSDVASHGTNDVAIPAGPWGSFGQGAVRRTEIPQFGFFEAYVNLDALGFVPLCAGTATLSVRSRSSASIDSELKDLAGPISLGGGDIDVLADVDGSCDLTFNYSAEAFDLDGDPIDVGNLSCLWECSSEPARTLLFDETACSGTGSVAAGDGQPVEVTCTVSVTEVELACEGDGDDNATVYTPLSVTIGANPSVRSCSVPGSPGSDAGDIGEGFVFTPTITGGTGSYTVSWTVNGPNDASCAGNPGTCTIDIPVGAFCGRTNVQAHVEDGVCVGVDSNVMHVEKKTIEEAKSGS